MASIKLYWHPYEGYWVAEANWSDNVRWSCDAYNPRGAVERLLVRLASPAEEKKP